MATAEQIGNGHGYLCPQCKSGQDIRIAAVIWVELVPDGTDFDQDNGDHEWDDSSTARCAMIDCEWTGTVGQLLEVEIDEEGEQ